MIDQQHPITPPPELVREWCAHSNKHETYDQFWCHIATQAARWGADQELEACCEWFVRDWTDIETADKLRAARRPKPPSLKEQALVALSAIALGADNAREFYQDVETIKTALEALTDD